jgi:hypothetical protein
MLFQHLYNWIKYKTLPPSILFKNRLYIERDSKFRRITNNLGLTFRNTKWTNYEMNNLHSKFFTSYFTVLAFIAAATFIIFTYFNVPYYTTSTVFNNVAFVFWSGIDLLDYYIDFIIWSTVVFLSTFFKGLYSYFYTPFVNSDKQLIKLLYLEKFKDEKLYSIFDNPDINKKDFKWILFNWLNYSVLPFKDVQLEKFFLYNTNENKINNTVLFLHNFFKLHNLLDKLATNYRSNTSVLEYKQWISTITSTSTPALSRPSFFFYIKFYCASYATPTMRRQRTFYTLNNFTWNLHKNFLQGLFVVNNFTPQNCHSNYKCDTSFFLNNNLVQKLTISKTYRWLYKYSLIHRRNFKNTHKLTLTKKLINIGFLNKNLSDKNLWYSVFSKKFSKINLAHSLNNLFYKTHLELDSVVTLDKLWKETTIFPNKHMENLHVYENSFFWLLKRFALFNHLSNNKITSSTQKNFKIKINENNSLITTNSSAWVEQNPFLDYQLLSIFNFKNLEQNNFQTVHKKDFTLFFENQSFFETFNNLFATLLVSDLTPSHINSNLPFFFDALMLLNTDVVDNKFLLNNVAYFSNNNLISSIAQTNDVLSLFEF